MDRLTHRLFTVVGIILVDDGVGSPRLQYRHHSGNRLNAAFQLNRNYVIGCNPLLLQLLQIDIGQRI
ncbi:hypothetical protein D3C80_2189250 [compost metagenome]